MAADTVREDIEAAMAGKPSGSRAIAEAVLDEFPDLDLEGFAVADLEQLVKSGELKLTDSDHEDMRTLARMLRKKQGASAARHQFDTSMEKLERLSVLMDRAEKLNAKRKH